MNGEQLTRIKLRFVRHGETIHNKTQTISGHQPGQLTELGCQQAQKIGDYFQLHCTPFDIVYVSDLQRTRQTFENACLKAAYLRDIKTEFTPLIRERCSGIFENLPLNTWTEASQKENKGTREYKCEAAESYEDVMERGNQFLQHLVTNHAIQDKTKNQTKVLAVSHQGYIMEFHNVCRVLSGQPAIYDKSAKNCSMHEFEILYPKNCDNYEREKVRLRCTENNFVGHLEN